MRLPTERFVDGEGEGTASPTPAQKDSFITKLKRLGLRLALALVVVLYIVLGALLFQLIEKAQTAEEETQAGIKELLDQIRANLPEQNVSDKIESRLQSILDELIDGRSIEVNNVTVTDTTGNNMYTWDSFPAALLFTFSAVSTIGYGHIAPATSVGRVFCIVYTICGIPLFMISVADVGKFLWESIKLMCKGRLKGDSVGDVPLSVSVPFVIGLFVAYMILGALLMPLYERNMQFMDALYFNFVSMTTVGFGDLIPLNSIILPATLFYIFFGLALTTLAIEIMATAMRRFHYLGYPVRGAMLASVWVGGKFMSMDTVLRSMAKEFGVSEDEVAKFGLNFDELLEKAATEMEQTGGIKLPPRRISEQNGQLLSAERNEPKKYSGEYDNMPETWLDALARADFADDSEEQALTWMIGEPDNAD